MNWTLHELTLHIGDFTEQQKKGNIEWTPMIHRISQKCFQHTSVKWWTTTLVVFLRLPCLLPGPPQCPPLEHQTLSPHLHCHFPTLLRMARCQAQKASNLPGWTPIFQPLYWSACCVLWFVCSQTRTSCALRRLMLVGFGWWWRQHGKRASDPQSPFHQVADDCLQLICNVETGMSVVPCVCALVEYWLRGGDDVVNYSLPTNIQPLIRDYCNTVRFLYDLLDLHLNSVELCILQMCR